MNEPVRHEATPPYAWYLEQRSEQLRHAVASAKPVTSAYPGAPEALRQAMEESLDAAADDLIALSHDIHARPELGYQEHQAVEAVAGFLRARGHEVEVGPFGLETAVRAGAGTARPRVALLAEYDALPGVGHGCGHNVICAAAVGAFLAVAEVVGQLDGSVVLLGTPAEEGGGGKEWIARAGGFDDVDAALMVHPWGHDAAEHVWLGRRRVNVGFRGLPAHAAAMPFLGRNALDAAVTSYNLLGLLRQHLLPGDRVHAIITDGGQKPNIVPERAALSCYLRSQSMNGLAELCDRAQSIFEAAAAATGTVLEAEWDPAPPYLPVRNNPPLAIQYAAHLTQRGRRVPPAGTIPTDLTGSTDLGNISVRVPAIHPLIGIAPPEVPVHTPEFADWAVSEAGDRGVIDGAFGLAFTAADYLADEALREAVQAEFDTAGGVVDVPAFFGD